MNIAVNVIQGKVLSVCSVTNSVFLGFVVLDNLHITEEIQLRYVWLLVSHCVIDLLKSKGLVLVQLHLLTLSTPHATIVMLSHCVQKVPSLELLRATEFSVRLV